MDLTDPMQAYPAADPAQDPAAEGAPDLTSGLAVTIGSTDPLALPTAVRRFAEEIGPVSAGPVCPVGGRTQWKVGGLPARDAGGRLAREVRAPAGILEHHPAEMVVRCLAGTTIDDLDAALAHSGQCVALPGGPGATVGGVLAVGRSGIRRLGWGHVRDTLLQVRFVGAEGRVATAGGAVVKNVSGFDLCRLVVGSLGTLGVLAEVVLRCRPMPVVERWLVGEGEDPFALRRRLPDPTAILWDGGRTWVLLGGDPGDVAAQVILAGPGFLGCEGPPHLPTAGRRSLRPGALAAFAAARPVGCFVAEIGVGSVHLALGALAVDPTPEAALDPGVVALNRRVKALFDPTGRLNPGRDPLAALAGTS